MSKLVVLNKPVDPKDTETREQYKLTLEELVKKYFSGNSRVEISNFFPDEFDIFKNNEEIARLNIERHTLGVVTESLPNWLVEVIAEIESGDHITYTICINN
jgi:hypothetical protein